jgi:Starch-binding associating with outer membrane/Susd and RagB outer membrane lipoprotein
MKLKYIIVGAVAVFTLGACSKKFEQLLNNPNNPSPDAASADLFLTQAQLSFVGFFNTASNFGREVTRQTTWSGPTYLNGYSPANFNGMWSTAYTGVLKHINALLPLATEQKKFVHVAIAKTLKAYTIMTLVDFFGDVPLDEANLGLENTNPKLNKGSDVYAKAVALLIEAKADLAKTSAFFPGALDLFYNTTGSDGIDKWNSAINTLLLRAYLGTRLVDNTAKAKIDALIADGKLITTTAQDFEFKYGTKIANPDNRHPRYDANYDASGNAGDYLGTWMMWIMAVEKGTFSNAESRNNSDPRTRYYFYRQRTSYSAVTQDNLSCAFSAAPAHYPADMPFCIPDVAGFWGRDHGDNSGTPPDGNLRTTWGIYPAGGEFDKNQSTSVTLSRGGRGAGIAPIWLSNFTNFALAEAALTLGTAGNPRTLLEAGVRSSINKVINYPATILLGADLVNTVDPALVPTQARIDAYVAKVLALYDAAATPQAKLDVIMKEWYIALWGNGTDPYNNYRRTGFPSKMQPARLAAPGEFVRSMLYPADHVNLNLNGVQKTSVGTKVFWDTNPPGFIN